MKELSATLTAVIAAATLPAVIGAVLTPIHRGAFNTDPVSVLELSLVLLSFSLPAALVLGYPLFALLRRFELVRWWTATLGGAVVGCVVAALIRLPSTIRIADLPLMATEGMLSGLVFWMIWRRHSA